MQKDKPQMKPSPEYYLLVDAMNYIRSRHNYGKAKRATVREDLLKRWNDLLKEDLDD